MNRHSSEVTNFMKTYIGSRKLTRATEVATFENRYGDQKVIHVTRSGLHVKRDRSTVAIHVNQHIAAILGQNIKKRRLELNLTLEDVCLRAGLAATSPKARLWEIENSPTKQGIRLGTLFVIAVALETTPNKLLPTLEEVLEGAGVVSVSENTLKIQP